MQSKGVGLVGGRWTGLFPNLRRRKSPTPQHPAGCLDQELLRVGGLTPVGSLIHETIKSHCNFLGTKLQNLSHE